MNKLKDSRKGNDTANGRKEGEGVSNWVPAEPIGLPHDKKRLDELKEIIAKDREEQAMTPERERAVPSKEAVEAARKVSSPCLVIDSLNAAYAIDFATLQAHTQALREAQEALKVQQDLLGCVNEENPWLGVTAGLALRINLLKAAEQQAREAQEEIADLTIEYESRALWIAKMNKILGYDNSDGFHSTPGPHEIAQALVQRAQALEARVEKLTQEIDEWDESYTEQRQRADRLQAEVERLKDQLAAERLSHESWMRAYTAKVRDQDTQLAKLRVENDLKIASLIKNTNEKLALAAQEANTQRTVIDGLVEALEKKCPIHHKPLVYRDGIAWHQDFWGDIKCFLNEYEQAALVQANAAIAEVKRNEST